MQLGVERAAREEVARLAEEEAARGPIAQRFAAAAGFEGAADVVLGRCSMCHAREPVWDGVRWAPKGVLLETDADIARNAEAILLHAGLSRAMPPANITGMEAEDRREIVRWYRSAVN